MNEDLKIREIVRASWNLVKKNLWFLVVAEVVIFGVMVGYQLWLRFGLGGLGVWERVPLTLLGYLVSMLVALGWAKVYLRACEGRKLEVGDFLVRPRMVGSLLLSILLMGILFMLLMVLVFLGLWLLSFIFRLTGLGEMLGFVHVWVVVAAMIVAMVAVVLYFLIRLVFVAYLIVDKDYGAVEAVAASWRMTNGRVVKLGQLVLVVMVINLLGYLALVVGHFVARPLSGIVWAMVYKKMTVGDGE